MSSCFLVGDASLIRGSDIVVDMDDLDHAFYDGWFELICSSDLSHIWCHTGAYSPISIGSCRSPLIYMTVLSYKIRVRLMIWFYFVLIVWGASPESFSQIHTLWYSRDSWMELSQVHGFPHHHFRGVHIKPFMHPHGVILELSWQIGYIWCYTGAYLPPPAVEVIVLSQICYSFSHSTGKYFICFIGHHSCDFRRDELLVEHDVRILIALLAMTLQWIVILRLWHVS